MSLTVIVEPNPGGHRFQAVANVAALALQRGPVLVLTSTGGRHRPEFDEFLAHLDLAAEEPFDGPAPNGRQIADVIHARCRDLTADTVVVMDGDLALKSWWLVARSRLRSLPSPPRIVFFLTRYPARLELSTAVDVRFWQVRIAKAVLVALARLTGTLHRAVGFAGRDERSRGWLVKRARDPAICTAHARDRARLRDELGLPVDRKIVGIFGGVNVRKNPQLVFDAMLRAGTDADLLLAGPMTDHVRGWVDRLPPDQRRRLIVVDAFLPSGVLDRYLASSDVVALVMKLEGPSGIQGKAIAAGVPVVTAGSRTRARELRAMHTGEATDPDVESIAAALRRVLDRANFTADAPTDLPTAEAFAAAILGTRDARPFRPAAARELVRALPRRLRHHAAIRLLKLLLRPRPVTELMRLGSSYGGWWVPESSVRPGAVAYCAGAGEDITFDLALFERGCAVTTFDPTPRAIAHVEREAPADPRFRFEPVGWWDSDTEVKFYSPSHPAHVSHSIVNLRGTSDYFVAKVKPVHQLMADLGDDHIDIMKMDIEGAEYAVLDSLLEHGPLPAVLCVEFDQPAPLRRTVAAVRRLQRAGYRLNRIDAWNYTFTR